MEKFPRPKRQVSTAAKNQQPSTYSPTLTNSPSSPRTGFGRKGKSNGRKRSGGECAENRAQAQLLLHFYAKEINCLIGWRSPLTYDNKLLIYNAVLKPIWMYGWELWGCASKTNIHII
jgi:hypothetical protein